MKLQHLRAVLAVASHASLGRAARELGLTQSAITKILQEIEGELGVSLFVRTSRGTHCTEYGEMLAAHARTAFAQIDRAIDEIANAREGLSGHVRVGTLIAAAAEALPLALAELTRTHAGIRITIVEGTYDHLVPMLRRGELDLIAGRLPEFRYRDGLHVEALHHEEIAIVVRPRHPALRQTASLANLRRWPWILPPPGTSFRQTIEMAFFEHNLALPPAPCESLSVLANRRLVLETDHICPFPIGVVRGEIARGTLSRIPLDPPLWFGPVGICRRADAPMTRAAEELASCLVKVTAASRAET